MNQAAIQNHLIRLFERHDVELAPDEDWLVTDDDFPAIRATWHDGAAGEPGRLDVDIVLSEERTIEESFAGYGSGDAAWRDALANFESTTFHVVLAACWYVTDDRKIQLASWDIGIRTWDIFIGPFVARSAGQANVDLPTDIDTALATALKSEAFTPEVHWIRLFRRCSAEGVVSVEALLDNAPWPAGDRLLSSLTWPAHAQAYGARCFVMLDVRDY